jgi:hypothetical protein
MNAPNTHTMSPRAREASARVRKGIEAAELERRRSFMIIAVLWFILSSIEFRDLVRAESVRLVDVLIPVGMSLGWLSIIAYAWLRRPRAHGKESTGR